MAELFIPEPNEKQKLFLSAKQKYIGYGGARGGGKSWALRTKAKLLAFKHSGIRILIMRKTYPELEANHIKIMKGELVPQFARYNNTDKEMTFFNGSVIKFMYCARDDDLTRIQGHEYDVIMLDECTNMTEYQMKAITACMRGVNEFPKHCYFTCNPGGPGHGYIKRIFLDRRFNKFENPDDYVFIQALVDDNKALMESQPDYIEQLEALPEKLREAWRHGRWDVFEGQVFGEFTNDPKHYIDKQWTHVIKPFDIPRHWSIYRGFDWGYSHPFSVHWYAMDDKTNIMYCIRELYGCTGEADVGVEWTVDKVARTIATIEREDELLKNRKIIGIADPAIFAENGGESMAETMSKARVYFQRGDHARLAGKMQCHYRLAFDERGIPMFYVFDTCKHFIRTIPSLLYSETQVEDIDTKLEDHCYDEWRYVCMARPLTPRVKHTEKPIDLNNVFDPIGQLRDLQESRNKGRGSIIDML